MNLLNLSKAANLLFMYRLNANGLNKMPKEFSPKNSSEAYYIQEELKKLYLNLKDNHIIGKKIGCTNKKAQKQVNVLEPFYGNLFSKYSGISGCKLSSKKFFKPYLEPEFSFRIKNDINIAKAPYKLDQIIDFVDTVIPSIEIVDFRFKQSLKKIGINNLIASNGASEYWIKGKKEFKINKIDLTNHSVEVYINNHLYEKGNASNVLGNPLNSLLWLINTLASKNETLLKNYIISTGTSTSAIPIKKGYNVEAKFGVMGNVNFQFN